MSYAKRKHYVTFMSPGTFFSESSSKEISEWNPAEAVKLGQGISERYGAKPYGFYFETFITRDPVDDGEGGTLEIKPKSVASSGVYYLSGKLETYDQVVDRDDPKEEILRSNMRMNRYAMLVTNTNSFRSTMPFNEKDFVVDPQNGKILERGDDPKYMAYRKTAKARFDAYYDSLK